MSSLATQVHTDNVVYGGGRILVGVYESGRSVGDPIAERLIGDTQSMTHTRTTETAQTFSGDGPVARLLASVVTQIDHVFSFVCQDVSDENMELLFGGALETQEDEATAVTDEEIEGARQARLYALGIAADKPGGLLAEPGSVVVADGTGGGATVFTPTTALVNGAPNGAYRIDDRGMLWIERKSGAKSATVIPDGTDLFVDYTPVAKTVGQVRVTTPVQVKGSFRYVSDPASGEARDIIARKCTIDVSGETAWKSRSDPVRLNFTARAETPDDPGWPMLAINGRPA